jgi:branched-chain amino acid transport system ATP-binding protein
LATDILAVRDLDAHYHGIQALRAVSLSVEEGTITALIGPNGAGKSTFLNAVSGLVAPSAGAITFRGAPITGRRPDRVARMGILQVPEGRQILSPLSVEENLRLGQLALGGRSDGRGFTLDHVYDLFPILRQKRLQPGGSLSGGQQQMLAIGRALMGGPSVLMLDEPSLGLAPIVVDEVFRALTALNGAGLSILLVEQNARRALELSSHAYVLDQGSIVKSGPSAALAADPAIREHYLGHDRRRHRTRAAAAP